MKLPIFVAQWRSGSYHWPLSEITSIEYNCFSFITSRNIPVPKMVLVISHLKVNPHEFCPKCNHQKRSVSINRRIVISGGYVDPTTHSWCLHWMKGSKDTSRRLEALGGGWGGNLPLTSQSESSLQPCLQQHYHFYVQYAAFGFYHMLEARVIIYLNMYSVIEYKRQERRRS